MCPTADPWDKKFCKMWMWTTAYTCRWWYAYQRKWFLTPSRQFTLRVPQHNVFCKWYPNLLSEQNLRHKLVSVSIDWSVHHTSQLKYSYFFSPFHLCFIIFSWSIKTSLPQTLIFSADILGSTANQSFPATALGVVYPLSIGGRFYHLTNHGPLLCY